MPAWTKAMQSAVFTACLAITIVTAISNNLTAQEIQWIDDPQQAVDAAHQSGRMIVVSVGAGWCHYCKKMDRESWRDRSVATSVARYYVPLRLKDEQHSELIRSLQVHAFPTTLVFTPDRRLVARAEGYIDAPTLASLLDRAYMAGRNGQSLTNR